MSPFEVTGLMFLSMLFLMGAGPKEKERLGYDELAERVRQARDAVLGNFTNRARAFAEDEGGTSSDQEDGPVEKTGTMGDMREARNASRSLQELLTQ